ncbi:site-specific integrase [Pseudomonas monteilii]|jgi:integrase|uniref:Tyr recombinase domain-containing protein n=1 Tax=Pseudomonas putida TaxID=303 RepID=A0A2S3X161_PSEPU|nr:MULTISPECIES: site-specific integrase [Pseudomonas]HCF2575563.1 site-specific integrase [Pseudomonas aeruginosa]MBA1319778.1 site-specific integrase [Pseudomonas monteilii]MCE1020890.1 site-specific integrase [Pseudomonas monteilii]MCE1038429.1 site-specific integrase [Pseudomonas monteilii]MDH0025294.1 site-specific integrase [Pseudomonas monteilii]
MNPYKIKVVRFDNGERFPVLCYRQNGLPLYSATLWVLAELRAANLSTSTLHQALRSLMVLFITLDELNVDISSRMWSGQLLTVDEVESIVRSCKLPIAEINTLQHAEAISAWSTSSPSLQPIHTTTTVIRLLYISRYLDWITTSHLLKIGAESPYFLALEKLRVLVVKSFRARMPSTHRFSRILPREGLTEPMLSLMQQVIDPDSERNPWRLEHARQRNYLMIRWLLSLGVRRGELLGVKVSDINFQTNEVLIARRADDPADPRLRQPNVKTAGRLLALDTELAELTRTYVMSMRRNIRGARKHEYLWVASGSGKPMSLAALNKTFVTLRQNCPGLPENLCPHLLRHTWNDLFSEAIDKNNVSSVLEQKLRSRLMGWSETSGMAVVYNQRHIKKKATAVSLHMQEQLRVAGYLDE